jgi:hypothetical protein
MGGPADEGGVGRRFALPVLAAALLGLPGCFYGPLLGGGGETAEGEAMANVRAAIPAIEAYYADNGTYAGATVEGLRAAYDTGIGDVRLVGPLNRRAYCVESTVGGVTFSKDGPAAQIVPGPCGAPLVMPAPVYTDAEEAVLEVIPLIEAYKAEKGSYRGIENVSQVYGVPFPDIRIVVRNGGRTYCVEAPLGGPSAHFEGPNGPLAPGPCS